jgi:exopolysaccharide biosynthesis polyprenyl glycosylphosphotransferase
MKNGKKPVRIRSAEQRFILIIGDLLVAVAALWIALYFWAAKDAWLKFSLEFLQSRPEPWFWFLPLAWLILMVELYDTQRASRLSDTLRGIAIVALISAMLYLVVYFTSGRNSLPRRGVLYFIVAATLLTMIWRLLFIRIFVQARFLRRVLIVGAGKTGTTLLQVIRACNPPPFHVVGLIDDDPEKCDKSVCDCPVLGSGADLTRLIEELDVSDLILAITGEINGAMFQAVLEAEESGIEVTTMPVVYEEVLGRVPIFLLEDDWIIRSFVDQAHASTLYEIAKRLIDIVGGLVGVFLTLVILPFVSLAIVLDSGVPVFFFQNRLGKNGHTYKIIKFRTMVQDAEKGGVKVTAENDERITRVGWFLRRTHLDELPQFVNVLRGEMSMVGPRAERSELVLALQTQIPFYRARLLVKPGITGWAQINFGYAATVEDTAIKLEYDLYYIKHRTLVRDFVILLRTFGTVVGFRGQ